MGTALQAGLDALRVRPCSPLESEFQELFSEMQEPLRRYLAAVGLPGSDGEDIAQETFLALFVHLRDGKPRDNLRGWVFRTGRNLALKRRERNARSPVSVCPEDKADPSASPEESAMLSSERARLEAVVRTLPDRDRECLLLRAEGLRYREIAETLDMSLGAVAAALGRTFAKLAEGSGLP